ncbi:MAG: S9 family peptidase [Candidatus Cloacimonetes bacterium]|nr:S9 family peptidase [Candidatus Cloacimonadota bacterium]
MKTKQFHLLLIVFVSILMISNRPVEQIIYPETPIRTMTDTLHGITVTDDYRWLENGDDPEVVNWSEQQNLLTRQFLEKIPHRAFLVDRLNELWRYDDEGVPRQVKSGDRTFFTVKRKDQEKEMFYYQDPESDPQLLFNPNLWDRDESIQGFSPSPDGSLAAYGITRGGNENPRIRIIDVGTRTVLPDTLQGHFQYVTSWLPDNSGFYYNAKPLPGSVPPGDEFYWSTSYLHILGTEADMDRKIFYSDSDKAMYHINSVTEDNRFLVYSRGKFYKNEFLFRPLDKPEAELFPLVTGFTGNYSVDFLDDKILISTEENASNGMVYITDVNTPGRENWKIFIPESKDKLRYIAGISGKIYALYSHNATSIVKIYDLEGNYLRDLPLPQPGSVYISGYWHKQDIWVSFSSFTFPSTTFKYNWDKDVLELHKSYPLDIDVSSYSSEQIWYNSLDGTPVSMFLIYPRELVLNGNNPVLLTGYGGFNVSITPYFSTTNLIWVENGGVVAIPNLRGGGEYGESWHKAGMLENKQNVFDDFIAAAQWLISKNYTNPSRIAINGGSNGGLLVGAALVQRPDLFRVVDCQVPLLDMIRYHLFDFARSWTVEYGSAEDPEQLQYLLAYSPYHNVNRDIEYPAVLLTASENDARTDPFHARKMAAVLQRCQSGNNPVLLRILGKSGHQGGTTLTENLEANADRLAFLMHELDMPVPKGNQGDK